MFSILIVPAPRCSCSCMRASFLRRPVCHIYNCTSAIAVSPVVPLLYRTIFRKTTAQQRITRWSGRTQCQLFRHTKVDPAISFTCNLYLTAHFNEQTLSIKLSPKRKTPTHTDKGHHSTTGVAASSSDESGLRRSLLWREVM
jgi:hypothetical protein